MKIHKYIDFFLKIYIYQNFVSEALTGMFLQDRDCGTQYLIYLLEIFHGIFRADILKLSSLPTENMYLTLHTYITNLYTMQHPYIKKRG